MHSNLATNFNYDMLKLFEIENLKNHNDIDGEFYTINSKTSTKNLTLDFKEELQNTEEIVIEIIYRLNYTPYEYSSLPFYVLSYSDANNNSLQLLMFEFNKDVTGNVELISIQNGSAEVLYKFDTDLQFNDSNWHKFQISLSKLYIKIWLDCNLLLNQTSPTNTIIFEFFEKSKEQKYNLLFSPLGFNQITSESDIKKYTIIRQNIKNDEIKSNLSCSDLMSLNKNVSSPLDLTALFEQQFLKSTDKEKFYQFQQPIKLNVRVPQAFTKRDEIDNFCFDIVFRHEGRIQGQMRLFKLKNYGREETQSVSINSGKIITYILDTTHHFQHTRAKLQNFNIYDGKWHQLQVEFIPKKDKDDFGDTYSKTIKFYLDCDLIGEDNLPGYIPFMTIEQSGTFFENNLANSFTEFDVMSMEMKENYEKLTCEKRIDLL